MAGLMVQGTGSDVGKSVLVAGLCRALANRGIRVLPFKPQNMSNNAAVTVDGGEIGRAQALQALAARAAHTDMNPVLLKPQADRTSQLVVHGRVRGTLGSADFREGRRSLLPEVLESWQRLRALRSGGGRRRRLAGRDQPARWRYRQHGLRACGECAGGAGRRYRPGRGDRFAGGDARGA
jgi:hypothetical protein